jgi:hypothetical protein
MFRKALTLIAALVAGVAAMAQQYSLDAQLERIDGNTAMITCTGMAS